MLVAQLGAIKGGGVGRLIMADIHTRRLLTANYYAHLKFWASRALFKPYIAHTHTYNLSLPAYTRSRLKPPAPSPELLSPMQLQSLIGIRDLIRTCTPSPPPTHTHPPSYPMFNTGASSIKLANSRFNRLYIILCE